MKVSTVVYERDFSGTIKSLPGVAIDVERYSFTALGGPLQLSAKATGPELGLWELIETLRCPIEVLDPLGTCIWWGYVARVTIRAGAIEVGVSLDTMFNNVAVAYSYIEPGSQSVGQRKTTAYSSDADSVGEYGTKDVLLSLGGATDAQATQVRDTLLNQNRYPIPYWQKAFSTGGKITAAIEARGWWSTLGWRMYAKSTAASIETTTQIANAITGVGQFLTGTEIETASGISTSEYRDGDTTAQAEIEELLRSGTTANRRLRSLVTRERRVRVLAEPTAGSGDYALSAKGVLFDNYGNPAQIQTCPAGMWIKLRDTIPGTVDLSRLAEPSRIFVEEAEFSPARDEYRPFARGVPTPWEIGQLVTVA